MKGSFSNIAKVLKESREKTPWSQTDISTQLGYRNGQFISNIERGICNLPVKKVAPLCRILSIPPEVVKEAMMKDFSEAFDIETSNRRTHKEYEYDATANAL